MGKKADAAFQSGVQKAIADYDKGVKDLNKIIRQADKQGNAQVAANAKSLLSQLKDIKPMLDVLKRAESAKGTYTGPITQQVADTINADRAGQQYAGVGRVGGPVETVYARQADVAGFEGYAADQYFTKEKRSGISNTGQYYFNGKAVGQGEFYRLLTSPSTEPTAVEGTSNVGVEAGTGTGTETETGTGTGVGTGRRLGLGLNAEDLFFNADGTLASKNQADLDTATKTYQEQQAELEKQQQRQSIINILTDRFTRYNLQSLIPVIKTLAQEGASESTITLALKESEEYKKRFKANEIRQKNNLTVLEPAEYLNLEDKYRQVLRAYGLEQFNNDNYVSQFIENDVSLAEFTDRIQSAVAKVKNADQRVIQTLRSFYNINDTDLVAYVLDPNQQFPKVAQQFAVAEIGTAAKQQGIRSTVDVAEQLARQGITQVEAQRGYATIASLLPTAEKLSQIYGSQTGAYTLTEAEQEVFGSLASAQRKRQELAQKEISAFGGTSGVSRTALSSKSSGGAF